MRKERTNLELLTIKRNDGQLEWLPRNPTLGDARPSIHDATRDSRMEKNTQTI